MSEKIYIGCDDAAVPFKETIKNLLVQRGFEPVDVGVNDASDNTYYPYIAQKVAEQIQVDPDNRRGILICGTGIGMCITANKFKGVRAAVIHDIFADTRSRLSNDCNVICFGARVIGIESAKALLDHWLTLGHVVASSKPKVDAIALLERENFK